MARRSRETEERKGLPGFVIALLVVLILVLAVLMGADYMFDYVKTYNKAFDPGNTAEVEFVVPQGATTSTIANMLEEKGLIGNADIFRYKTKLNALDGSYQAGTFKLSASMTMEEIMTALQKAKSRDTVRFTIPEGYTLKQIAHKLAEEGVVESVESFYKALDEDYNYWFLDGKGSGEPDGSGELTAHQNRLEGFLFPDTYEVYTDVTPQEIIDKMLANFDSKFSAIYKNEIAGLREKMGKDEELDINAIVTIASMIERETRKDEEREIVASVIYNRLAVGMQLQLDCTIQYALGEVKERVLYSDLEIDSPYNTYKVEALPAGPIAVPGLASLKAALRPADTEYYYYVLKGDGSLSHNFAKNSKEFEQYKKEYINSL